MNSVRMWTVSDQNEVYKIRKTYNFKHRYYLVVWDKYATRAEAETVAAALNGCSK